MHHIPYVLAITALQFYAFHDIASLNPFNHGWFFHSGDMSSMLISQIYFLQQDNFLSIPLGNVNNYAGAWCGNLIKFEIPVILFTKIVYIISNYLGFNCPLDIQFFGIFNLVNMFLLNYFLLKILIRWNNNHKILILILSVLLISSSPYILFRNLIFHFNLASYWIVAACIYLAVRPNYKFLPWVLLTFCAGIIHPYLIPFPFLMWLIIAIDDLRAHLLSLKNWSKFCMQLTLLIASLVIPILLISGIWLKTGQLSASGLGTHHSNLLSIFDSNGYSTFLKNISTLSEKNGDYEGFGYIGLGSILFVFVAFFFVFKRGVKMMPISNQDARLLICAALFFLLSTGGVIAVGTYQLYAINFNDFIYKAYSIFRSSGRFIVFSILLLQLFSIRIVYLSLEGKKLLVFLISALILQIYDEKSLISELRSRDQGTLNTTGSDVLSQIKWSEIHELEFIVPENSHYEWKMNLIYQAAMRGIPTNDAFCARPNDQKLYKLRGEIENRLISKKEFSTNVLYVLYPDKDFEIPSSKGWEKIPYIGGSKLITYSNN